MVKTFEYSAPRTCRLPHVPIVEANESMLLDDEPLKLRISRLEAVMDNVQNTEIDPRDGATQVESAAAFDALSHLDDVPGALGVREVKFLVVGVNTATPKVFFLNTKNQKYHFLFAKNVLNVPLENGAFNAVTYFTQNRKFLAGTIIAHDSFQWGNQTSGLFALEFWPTDSVGVKFATLAFDIIRQAMPFAGAKLAYHPSGAIQEELYDAQKATFAANGVQVIKSAEIFESVDYSPLNLGVGFGRLRVIDGTNTQPPSIRDIVIFKTLPNDLSHVAGTVSEEPQTPLSHVNLRAKQNDTPNAFLRSASDDPRLRPHIDKIIRFEVKPGEIDVRAATAIELEEHLEQQRPTEPQFPPGDLSEKRILNLDEVGHGDLRLIGAKAANLAELRKILDPRFVPQGFAVPFYFYDQFMKENDLYSAVKGMLEDPRFVSEDIVRIENLRALRRKIKKASVPTDLRLELGKMHDRFPPGTTPRCRSSTNNEDLIGFNGAGLYDSFTHREDEGHIEKSIKQVWASLWNYRAFEERSFYRIDHFTTYMGVLVHPNFDDEKVNGVALTKNIYFPGFAGFYVNAQVGEALVTNPDPNATSEEFLVMEDADPNSGRRYETIRIRRSNLVEEGATVLSDDRLKELVAQMEITQAHFRNVYQAQDNEKFAMDLEFKVTQDSKLVIKQARPWVD